MPDLFGSPAVRDCVTALRTARDALNAAVDAAARVGMEVTLHIDDYYGLTPPPGAMNRGGMVPHVHVEASVRL